MKALIEESSLRLWEAERNRTRIQPLSVEHPELVEAEAYAIAEHTLQLRGRRRIGYKLGFTSAAMRAQMNIHHPNFGILTEDMVVPESTGCVDTDALVHPLIEPEIALLLGRDLRGPGQTRAGVLASVDAVMGSFDVVDTRYRSYQFAAVDNIADNSSAARVVLGSPRSLRGMEDLRLCGVLLWSRGAVLDQGLGANTLGDPLLAIAWLADFLATRNTFIPAGSLIMTGGLTRAYPAEKNRAFGAEFAGLGTVLAAF